MIGSESPSGWPGWIVAAVALTLLVAAIVFYSLRPVPHWVWWSVGGVVLLAVAVVVAGFIFALTHMPD